MTRTEIVHVGGFDLASVSSGVTYVRGEWDGTQVHIEALHERAYKIENHFVSHYECAKLMLRDTLVFKEKYGLDLCAVEDYTMQTVSQVSFSIGEIGGLVRGFHFDAGIPILLNKPMVMRSFAANGRKLPKGASGKRALISLAKEDFGHASSCHYSKERSDCCDAWWHSVLGVYTLLFVKGVPLDIISPKRQEIWRNKKGTGIFDTLEYRLLSPKGK